VHSVREPVPAGLVGERLDRVVSMMTGVSRSAASAVVAAGDVRVNDSVVTSRTHRLELGDVVDVPTPSAAVVATVEPDASVPLTVVHEDADVVVVDKAPGVVVHPGTGNPTGTLVNALVHRYPDMALVGEAHRPGLVHRLDADTSGLLVVARTEVAYEDLSAQMTLRTIERIYDALVWGRFEAPSGRVDAPVGRSRRHPTRMAVTADGKPAMTDYEVVTAYDQPVEVTRLRCRLHTGRTHQIRVHMTGIDHPVVGDPMYGGVRQSLVVPRLWLHAAELAFEHPVTGEPMRFTAPLPDDLAGVLDRLSSTSAG
jgi:23S rRNA pseudouridine1911/1915/1917 synthase